MSKIFEVDCDGLNQGYVNIRDAASGPEVGMRATIESMWEKYQPYADSDFCSGFAHDLDGRFWEMLLGCTIIDAGLDLLLAKDRESAGGQPDLCVIDNGHRTWIEAIAPERGEPGPDQVPELDFDRVFDIPIRQTRLRLTSAFWTKSQKIMQYIDEGIITPDDKRVIAISGCRFAMQILDDPPLPLTSLFPVGNEVVSIDRTTGDAVRHDFQYQSEIFRDGEGIPRTAFMDTKFSHISGVLWSRIGIGNLSRDVRPLTMVHNPIADVPISKCWGPWDREYVAKVEEDQLSLTDIRQ